MNIQYLLQRILSALLVIWGVSLLVFLIIQLVPGDPARIVLGAYASQEQVDGIRERMGLNEPILKQYVKWLGNALRGDFGSSLLTAQPVAKSIWQKLPRTVELGLASLAVGSAVAFPIGIYTALHPGKWLDIVGTLFSQLGVSIPSFWFAILMISFFSVNLGILPPGGYVPLAEGVGPWLKHLIMPALATGLVSASIQTRFIRSAMLDVLSQPYIQTARAKGLTERLVLNRHALRNALINIVTILGLQVTVLLSGSVIAEVVFSWPGLGGLSLDAVLRRDYTMLQATVLMFTSMVVFVNLAVDMTYFFLDPRIEYA